jgi:ion channel-forming bestrophin family protein
MNNIRGAGSYRDDLFAGILAPDQVRELESKGHPPLYAAYLVRYHLRAMFVSTSAPTSASQGSAPLIANGSDGTGVHFPQQNPYVASQVLTALEHDINVILDQIGGMERIRSTPLPIVYVAHLRTFLLVALLLFPYVFGPALEWSTIPVVALVAVALLGIEAASVEVECPFRHSSPNALNMDKFCETILSNVYQLCVDAEHHQRQSTNSVQDTIK